MVDDIRRLNWGCGPEPARGWYNSDIALDRIPESDPYMAWHQGDILDGLPWPDGFFDGIVANHSLQSLTHAQLPRAIAELHRVTKPDGGRLRVLVPDVLGAFRAWRRCDFAWPGFAAISEEWDLDRKLCHYLTWGGMNRSTFTAGTLAGALERGGFRCLGALPEFSWLRELDSRLGESIIVEVVA